MPHTDRRIANRRVGERVPASLPIEVTLIIEDRIVVVDASMVDVSISGCRLLAPLAPSLAVGTVVMLNTTGGEATCLVRRSEVGCIPGKAFFGMEFADLDDGFRVLLFQTISDGFRAVPAG